MSFVDAQEGALDPSSPKLGLRDEEGEGKRQGHVRITGAICSKTQMSHSSRKGLRDQHPIKFVRQLKLPPAPPPSPTMP